MDVSLVLLAILDWWFEDTKLVSDNRCSNAVKTKMLHAVVAIADKHSICVQNDSTHAVTTNAKTVPNVNVRLFFRCSDKRNGVSLEGCISVVNLFLRCGNPSHEGCVGKPSVGASLDNVNSPFHEPGACCAQFRGHIWAFNFARIKLNQGVIALLAFSVDCQRHAWQEKRSSQGQQLHFSKFD